MLNVHVRVNDASAGKPTPVRLHISDAAGKYYPPLGQPPDFPVGRNQLVGRHIYANEKRYAYIDGGCEIPLPSGVPLTVEISKGPCYVPRRETVVLGAGQIALRFAIQRLENTTGFVAADSRCHFLSPHAAKLEAAAEGLDITNLLARVQEYPSIDGHMYQHFTNIEAFSGQTEAVSGVYVNTFNTHPVLGQLALLNCHRAVYPLTFGGDDFDDWSLADWCQQCHRKKGLAVWCDAYRIEKGVLGGEGLIDAILGKLDAIEIDSFERKTPFMLLWYRLLNAGVRVPLIGGSGKASNRDILGSMRTLTPVDEHAVLSYAEWIEYVRSGRTVVTNGPLLRFTVNDEVFPAALKLTEPQTLRLRADVLSVVPFERLELIANGEVIGQTSGTQLEVEHRVERTSWLAARCWSAKPAELYPGQPVFAHSSAVWVDVEGQPFERSAGALSGFRRDVQTVQDWVESTGQFANPRRKEHLLTLVTEALAKLA